MPAAFDRAVLTRLPLAEATLQLWGWVAAADYSWRTSSSGCAAVNTPRN